MSDGFRKHVFTDSEWGQVTLWRPLAIDENLDGILSEVKETPWFSLIPLIPGEVFSHAFYGRTHLIWKHLGRDPKRLGEALTPPHRLCNELRTCGAANEKGCWPGKKMPLCYQAPYHSEILTFVAQTWVQGHYVVRVGPGEFTI